MSDYFLVVIPTNPNAELPATAERVRATLGDIAGTTETRVKDYGKMQFIDCGENFQRVSCPHCRTEISIEDWHGWMDEDWHGEKGFHLHRHTTPCCGNDITVNDLDYDFSQGFARWMISARNSNRGPLTDDELERLEDIAGIGLRAISQMY